MIESSQTFSPDTFLGRYETIIRKEMNTGLDSAKKNIAQIEERCLVRIMNLKPNMTRVEDLLKCDSDIRCKTVSALLYNDALWRLEASQIMMCIGLFSIAYANMRSTLDALLTAFIVERLDKEALRFLRNEKVNLPLAEQLIPSGYNEAVKSMKDAYSILGVHSYLDAVQLSNLFGANRFDKYVGDNTKIQKAIELPEPKWLIEAATMCINDCGKVTLLFHWLESLPVK